MQHAIAIVLVGATCACGAGARSPEAPAAPAAPAPSSYGPPELLYAWSRMPYDFRTPAEADAYRTDEVYQRAPLAGVDVDRHGNIYVTTPRWLDRRVPSSLNQIVTVDGAPVLRPFPSWEQNRLGDPGAFQNVLGVEIDSRNRMWILDMGWVAGVTPTPDGAQKLVVLDLDTGAELRRFAIPDAIANRTTSFLNDLTIDERHDVAFLSDSGNRSGSPTASGIVIYDFKTNTARRVLDRDPHVTDDPTRTLAVDGEPVFAGNRLAIGINGITLSADGTRLYWSITTGDALYDAPTAVLLDPNASPAAIAASVVGPRRIGGGSDGIATDSKGRIYFTNLAHDAVEVLDPATDTISTVAASKQLIWPDSLSWDDRGRLYVSSNHLNHAFGGTMSFADSTINFRIFRIQTDAHKGFVR